MNSENKMRRTINQLAKKYREQVNPNMTQEEARKRVIKGMTSKQK